MSTDSKAAAKAPYSVTLQGHAIEGVWLEGPTTLVEQTGLDMGGVLVEHVQVTLMIHPDADLWAVIDMGQSEMDIKIVHAKADGSVRTFFMKTNTLKPTGVPLEIWNIASHSYDGYIAGW